MKIFWHTDINNIRIPSRIDYLKPDIDRQIIIVVSLIQLLKSLDKSYNNIYSQTGFFASNLNTEKLIKLTALLAKKRRFCLQL